MSTLNVPNIGINSFTVINATSVSYNGTIYEGVTDIQNADGTHTTCAAIIQAAGGESYSASELKECVKIEALDPDANGRQLWLAYSSNSHQTAKNATDNVTGGVAVDVLNFNGNVTTNYLLRLFENTYGPGSSNPPGGGIANSVLRAFKINYGISESHAYVLTQVNQFGEESIPSPPLTIGTTIMHDAQISGIFVEPAPIAGNAFLPISRFKLYRAAITTAGSFDFERVPVDPVSVAPNVVNGINPTTGLPFVFPDTAYAFFLGDYVRKFGYTITDNVTADKLLESLPSLDWDAPPPRSLLGLAAWRNGIMTAFTGNQLYFCEPYRPFTFPQKYIKVLPRTILGTCVDGNDLIVVTDGEPYVFHGSHPQQVTYDKLQGVQAGLRPALACTVAGVNYYNPTRAIVRTPMGVYYASREGMVRVSGGQASMVWGGLFTRDVWVQRYGAGFDRMRLAYFDGHILGYFDGMALPGFLVNIGNADPQLSEWVGPGNQVADFVLPQTDSMYVVTFSGGASTISRFADENQLGQACSYWTRDVILPKPLNMGVLQVVGTGTVTVSVYADGVLRAGPTPMVLGSPANALQIRLPAGFEARRWSVSMSLATGATVSEVYLAGTPLELMSV